MRRLSIALLPLCNLIAQSASPSLALSAGFKAGAPVNDPVSGNSQFSNSTQGRWTGGPTVEVHLPFRFALEFDALYRTNRTNLNYSYQLGPGVSPYNLTGNLRRNVWDFPLLLKYRFRLGPARPFVSAGLQWSRESIAASSFYQCQGPSGCVPADYPGPAPQDGTFKYSTVRHGLIAGAGLEFRTRYVTIAPEARFHRPVNYPHDNRFAALVGFTFGGRK